MHHTRHAGLDPASPLSSCRPEKEEAGPRVKPGVTELFSTSAARLAGLAGALLGWRPDEFWRATPAELAAVFDAMRGDAPAKRVDVARLMEMFPDG